MILKSLKIFSILFGLLGINLSNAGELECIEEYDNKNFELAFVACSSIAESTESPEVWFRLAHMYDNGDGTATNANEAFKWYTKAAYAEHSDAQYNLALLYIHGRSIEQNEELAIKWLTKSAENGDPDATKVLALHYNNGQKLFPKATIWLVKANRLTPNDPEIEYYLANNYLIGNGTDQNTELGIKTMKLAAQNGNGSAIKKLGFIYFDERYTKQDIEQAYFWWATYTKACPKYAQEVSDSIKYANSKLSTEKIDKINENVDNWLSSHPIKIISDEKHSDFYENTNPNK